jgi:hypothetical protein
MMFAERVEVDILDNQHLFIVDIKKRIVENLG